MRGAASASTPGEMSRDEGWPEVVAVAGRLARVMVGNDLGEILALHEARGAAEA